MRVSASNAVRAAQACVVACVTLWSSGALGEEEERTKTDARTEFTPAPIIGGSTDIGFGGGVIASLARVKPGLAPYPYVYKVEFATATTVKSVNGTLKIPFQDDYVLVSLPHLMRDLLNLELRASFTHEATQKYYGV